MSEWTEVEKMKPEEGRVVMTKIDDAHGSRNEGLLKRGGINGNIWFTPDGGVYVYYTPTHWKPK